jgi:hypothetical protein
MSESEKKTQQIGADARPEVGQVPRHRFDFFLGFLF